MTDRSEHRARWRPLGSPYTLRESGQWVLRYLFPTTGRLDEVLRAPRCRVLHATGTKRIILFGDIMAPPYGTPPIVDKKLQELFRTADLAIGNLEAPIGSDQVSHNRFQISQDTLVSILRHLGLEPERCRLSIANNHIGDTGSLGAVRTVKGLQQIGIGVVGQLGPQDCPSVRAHIGDLSIDLVAWTQWMNHPFSAGAVRVCRQPHVLSWIGELRPDRADLTIALPHWGYEYTHTPRPVDRRLAAQLTEGGVDLIAGHHAHVIQPAESLGAAACFYGLGGLVQARAASPRWPARLGSILIVDIARDLPEERGAIRWGYEVVPIVHIRGREEHRLSLLENAPSRERDRMRRRFGEIYPAA